MFMKLKTMKLLVTFLIFSFGLLAQNQPSDTLYGDTTGMQIQVFDEITIPKNFKGQYRLMLSRVRRVYPLALHAADIIDSMDREMSNFERKSKQKKVIRQTKNDLMQDFKFVIKDLYVSEGKVLTKLVYRETGLTVRDIVKKYRNGFEAAMYDGVAKIFEQNLDATYDPEGEDFILECVIQDIISGKVEFDPTFRTMAKAEYKEMKKEQKVRRKKSKKVLKQREKDKKSQMVENKKSRE